ncbi:heme oxygenase (decycling) 1 [Podila epigama]|nr:heme oxygenase (decycling) 1 [Podila epigama]
MTDAPLLLTDELRLKTRGLHGKMDRIVQLGLFTVLDYKEEYESHLAQENPHPWLKYTYTPEMRRTEAFEKDLAYFYGPNWKEETEPNHQALEYMSHIREISKKHPERLVAYPSTLYLGIFFGGMITRSKIIRSTSFFPSPPQQQLGGEQDNGIAIFTFRNKNPKSDQYGHKEDPNKIKALLKGRLNSIPGIDSDAQKEERNEIGKEAVEIFVRNIDIMSSARGIAKVWARWVLHALLYLAIAFALFQLIVRRSAHEPLSL